MKVVIFIRNSVNFIDLQTPLKNEELDADVFLKFIYYRHIEDEVE